MAEVPKSVLDARIHEAYADADYLKEDGSRDSVKMRARMMETIKSTKVLHKKERAEKAITKGNLVAAVFPTLPGPEAWKEIEDENERAVAEAVYARISTIVWGETLPDASKSLQQSVESAMGNGYVLCRTTVGNDNTQAVYITDNLACIRLDYTFPEKTKFEKLVLKHEANREMLIRRQPENARAYFNDFKSASSSAVTEGVNRLKLVMDTTVNEQQDDVDEDGEE